MLKEKIIHCFDLGSKTYNKAADIQVITANYLQNLLPLASDEILEVGCGTGLFTVHLIQKFPKANLLVTDISPCMMKQSQQQFSSYPNIKMVCMDGEKLSLKKSFDLIVSNMMFHWMIDFSLSLTQLMKQLASKGELIFSLLGSDTLKEWRDVCTKRNLQHGILHFPDVKKLRSDFSNVEFTTKKIVITYPNAYALLNTLKKIGGATAPLGYQSLSMINLRQLLRGLDHEFDVTYEVIYGRYVCK